MCSPSSGGGRNSARSLSANLNGVPSSAISWSPSATCAHHLPLEHLGCLQRLVDRCARHRRAGVVISASHSVAGRVVSAASISTLSASRLRLRPAGVANRSSSIEVAPPDHPAEVAVQAVGRHGEVDRLGGRREQVDRRAHDVTVARALGHTAVGQVLHADVAQRADRGVEQAQVDEVTAPVALPPVQGGADRRRGVRGGEGVDDRQRMADGPAVDRHPSTPSSPTPPGGSGRSPGRDELGPCDP